MIHRCLARSVCSGVAADCEEAAAAVSDLEKLLRLEVVVVVFAFATRTVVVTERVGRPLTPPERSARQQ